jgi:Uma2 family endonuclease
MGFMAQGGTLTYRDLLEFPDDGKRREIIDGELFVSAAPYLRHQRLVGRLFMSFASHLEAHGGGAVYFAPADVVLSDINVVEPDLLFVADDQRAIETAANIQGVPALVVEVVSNPRTPIASRSTATTQPATPSPRSTSRARR